MATKTMPETTPPNGLWELAEIKAALSAVDEVRLWAAFAPGVSRWLRFTALGAGRELEKLASPNAPEDQCFRCAVKQEAGDVVLFVEYVGEWA